MKKEREISEKDRDTFHLIKALALELPRTMLQKRSWPHRFGHCSLKFDATNAKQTALFELVCLT
jgi:hypothetical protein